VPALAFTKGSETNAAGSHANAPESLGDLSIQLSFSDQEYDSVFRVQPLFIRNIQASSMAMYGKAEVWSLLF
jgi:hypothetical protein